MIILKTASQVNQIIHNGQILRQAAAAALAAARPGCSTLQLDNIIEDVIRQNAATPTFKGYKGFPAASCISVNEVLVHGIPSSKKLKAGDVVSIDIGVTKNGCIADSCFTFSIADPDPLHRQLMRVAHDATMLGISLCKSGVRIHDIAKAVFEFVEKDGLFTVAEGFFGHGTGIQLHEAPSICFTYPCPKQLPNPRLSTDMVITIEPVICFKSTQGKHITAKDGWTVSSVDGSYGAQFEHTILIQSDTAQILTGSFDITF